VHPSKYAGTADRAFDANMLGNPFREIRESAKDISVSRDRFTLAVRDMGERSETINFQFKDVLVGIEWF
jgi:hypothetical protein